MTIENITDVAEQKRLNEAREAGVPWKKWGPYLSERQWGTVREDYSRDGNAWDYFSHDQSRSRAYRWGEDGLGGISDDKQQLCFALALWNGRDPILKERLFGLTNSEGNHGEDVKEYYFYVDSTPTHSYMKYLYKYPQAEYPYRRAAGKRIAARARSSNTSCSTRASSMTTGTSTSSSSTRKRAPTTSSSRSRRIIAAPTRRACACCRRSGSATRGPGAVTALVRRCGPLVPRPSRRRTTRSARTRSAATARRSCCSPRTNPTRRVSGASPIRRLTSRTRSTSMSSPANAMR